VAEEQLENLSAVRDLLVLSQRLCQLLIEDEVDP
jgi:hypothetical protein